MSAIFGTFSALIRQHGATVSSRLMPTVRRIGLGLLLLATLTPLIDRSQMVHEGFVAAYAFKKLGGSDKIGWANRRREWCKKHPTHTACTWIVSVESHACVQTNIAHLKNACPGHL